MNPLMNIPIGNNNPVTNNISNMLNQFKQNPMQFLTQRQINIPQELQNNPKEAVQYLLNNGQMTQEGFNKLQQMASQMGVKLQ